MNMQKGMSQTLALIVAASVLMMTALTVIFLAQGSLGSFGEDSAQNACTQAVQSSCQAALASSADDTAEINAPSTCLEGDSPIVSNTQIDPHEISGNDVTCNAGTP